MTEYEITNNRITEAKRIAELEKENAELKEKLNFSTQYYKGEKAREQLIKAKKLLKRYVKIYVNPYPEEEIELRNEAEQFISEVEK